MNWHECALIFVRVLFCHPLKRKWYHHDTTALDKYGNTLAVRIFRPIKHIDHEYQYLIFSNNF